MRITNYGAKIVNHGSLAPQIARALPDKSN